MAKPAKHGPAYTPTRHTDGACGFGAAGTSATFTRGVRTAHPSIDHLCWPLQWPKMMIAVIAHGHITVTDWPRALLDLPSNPCEYGAGGPTIRHGRSSLLLKAVGVS